MKKLLWFLLVGLFSSLTFASAKDYTFTSSSDDYWNFVYSPSEITIWDNWFDYTVKNFVCDDFMCVFSIKDRFSDWYCVIRYLDGELVKNSCWEVSPWTYTLSTSNWSQSLFSSITLSDWQSDDNDKKSVFLSTIWGTVSTLLSAFWSIFPTLILYWIPIFLIYYFWNNMIYPYLRWVFSSRSERYTDYWKHYALFLRKERKNMSFNEFESKYLAWDFSEYEWESMRAKYRNYISQRADSELKNYASSTYWKNAWSDIDDYLEKRKKLRNLTKYKSFRSKFIKNHSI